MEFIILGVDAVIFGGLYLVYRHKKRLISYIQCAPEIDVSTLDTSDLSSSTVEYCMIEGIVKPNSPLELTSQFNPEIKGVIRMFEVTEHGRKWQSNISFDTNRLITRVINDCPFSLTSPLNSRVQVNIEQALEAADYLLESMDLTFNKFEPSEQSTLARLIADFAFSETVRGIETTERMLRTGSKLTVFGKLERFRVGENLALFKMTEPTLKGGYSYVITTLSRPALVKRLSGTTKALKISLFIFGAFGCALGAYCAYRSYESIRAWLNRRRISQELAKARRERVENERRQRRRNDGNETPLAAPQENLTCVICLSNPRELLLLDCGHVCLCMNCFEQLPTQNCPVCRQPYRDFAPCYFP